MYRQHTPPLLADKSWSRSASCAKTTDSSVGSLRLSELSVATVATPSTVSAPLSRDMAEEIVLLARTIGHKLVQEVPVGRKPISTPHDFHLFQCHQLQTPQPPIRTRRLTVESRPNVPLLASTKHTIMSFSRSVWNHLTRRRKRAGSRARGLSNARRPLPESETTKPQPPPKATVSVVPRIAGLTNVHVSLDELVDIIGHRSAHATALLHPSMRRTGYHHTLIDTVDEHVCVRSTTLRTSTPTMTTPRDFLMVEHHHAFETPTGQRGYAVACHSVHWDQCPSPSEGAVRGSLYESGLVAIESETEPDTVQLYCVAEMNLKGRATEAENMDASRHRVIGTLSRITKTIEERTKMLLSLDHTHAFHKARRAMPRAETCSGCNDRIGKRPSGVEPYACRKCYVKVCGDCSSIWQRGQKRMRLCMECWTDAELNRTCSRPQRLSDTLRVLY